jgi:prepilin peptidase CpaA
MHMADFTTPAALALLILAAAHDVVARTIPDRFPLILAALSGAGLVAAGSWTAGLATLGAAAAVFAVLAVFCVAGILGGGDVKLAAAAVLLVEAHGAIPFLMAMLLTGGILSLAYLGGYLLLRGRRVPAPPARGAERHCVRHRLGIVLAAERWRIARKQSIPYGVAISCAAALTLSGAL